MNHWELAELVLLKMDDNTFDAKRNVGTCPTIVKRKVVIKNVVGCSFLQNSPTLYAKEYV